MTIKDWRHNKDAWLAALGLVIIILITLIALRNNNHNQAATNKKSTTVSIAASGMKYPAGWQELHKIDASDKAVGVISEADRSGPVAKANIKLYKAVLAKDFNIKTLPDEIVSRFRDNLVDFVLVSKSISNLSGNQAVVITYKDSSGNQIYEHTQFTVPTANKTFYLTISAKEADFQQISKDISEIGLAFGKYVADHK